MELQHIEIENLETTKLNVRKIGAKDIADILPSIRSLGVLQPLLVRKTRGEECGHAVSGTTGKQISEGYEIIAGQRRYHAAVKVAEEKAEEATETGASEESPDTACLPCIIMEEGDDAKAIEASLAENITRLPMDEIDQYKAFAALVKKGKTIEDIAGDFGVTTRLVKQRLAIANLIAPILSAYRKDDLCADTIRQLTLATKRQQKDWWALFTSEDEYAPQHRALKEWLFGGAEIPVENALFDVEHYGGGIVTDLFSENRYFDDATKFWELQNTAIAEAKERYQSNGWQEVTILDVGKYWHEWEHVKSPKTKGGHVYVSIAKDGEVTFHEGYLTEKLAKKIARVESGEVVEDNNPERPELTKVMQNYLDLHRHAAVRCEVLNHQSVALRLAVAQMIAGSDLWTINSDPQKANTDAIKESLATNKAEALFANERSRVRTLLGLKGHDDTLVYKKDDWDKSHDLHQIFVKLEELSDEEVIPVLTFVVAETLPCGSATVEGLGAQLCVDMADHWSLEDASTQSVFFDLMKDKEAINAMVKQVGGKATADAHVSSTAKVQKQIIADCLNGVRTPKQPNWQPRYMDFPCGTYTKRGGIDAVTRWKQVKKHYAS